MKRTVILYLLAVSLLLTGCGWMDGSYVSITPHREEHTNAQNTVIAVTEYRELLDALEEAVSEGTEMVAINMEELQEMWITSALRHVTNTFSIGAYAVDTVEYEPGIANGKPAMAVQFTYHHSRAEIQRIRKAVNTNFARVIVSQTLREHEPGVVLYIENYEAQDFVQWVNDYALEHPDIIMEIPQVTENIYGKENDRVVELMFTYQTSRDSLRRMQSQVQPVFDSAALYVSGDGEDRQKFSQLYGFLMERFEYKVETSITPAYSLLRHGVGDSRAFATVYAAMCRNAGLECMTVTGTHAGEPRTWNIVLDNEQYYHVDLLRCNEMGKFAEFTDSEMEGYVWDYSAYPVSSGKSGFIMEETEPVPATTAMTETAE